MKLTDDQIGAELRALPYAPLVERGFGQRPLDRHFTTHDVFVDRGLAELIDNNLMGVRLHGNFNAALGVAQVTAVEEDLTNAQLDVLCITCHLKTPLQREIG